MKHSTFISRGFTLLELLIVIAIIALLISIGTVSFSTSQQKGRNSRRMSDMQAIRSGLEQYYAANNAYPTTGCSIGSTYFPAGLPQDPKNSGIYTYTFDCDTSTVYCVCAQLEPDDNSLGNYMSNTCATSSIGWREFYCVKNLQ